jgi:hypothetical protein
VLGMLNHLTNGTCPNIAFAVSVLMCYTSSPCPFHWRLVQCVIAYLKTTIDYVTTHQKGGSTKLIGYSDVLHGDDPDSQKSMVGQCKPGLHNTIDACLHPVHFLTNKDGLVTRFPILPFPDYVHIGACNFYPYSLLITHCLSCLSCFFLTITML